MNISPPVVRRAVTASRSHLRRRVRGGAAGGLRIAGRPFRLCGIAGRTTPSSPSAAPSSPSDSPSSRATVHTQPRMPATQCPTSALRATVNKTRGGAAAGTNYVRAGFHQHLRSQL